MRFLLAFFVPWLVFFKLDRPFAGILCLILQCTLIGWLPATYWCFYTIANFDFRIVNAREEQRAPDSHANIDFRLGSATWFEQYTQTSARPNCQPSISIPLILPTAIAGILLIVGGALAYWHLVYQPSRWFIDTPLHTARDIVVGDRTQRIQSTLLYKSGGKYSATNITYEYGKQPSEERYLGTWRKDKEWVCLRMDWMPEREFCNTFVKSDQGWILLNKAHPQATPVSLTALSPPSDEDLTPSPSPVKHAQGHD